MAIVSKRPWLDDFDKDDAMKFVNELTDFMCRPAFGAQPKREVELRVFALLYGGRLAAGDLHVAKVAADLAISRAKAKSLMLDTRARYIASEGVDTEDLLAEAVSRWPKDGVMELDGERLRLVVDDPYIRDLLKNHAFQKGIVIDGSFAGEIVSLTWPSYERLLRSLASPGDTKNVLDDVVNSFGAEVRKNLVKSAKQQKDFDDELEALKKSGKPFGQKLKGIARSGAKHAAGPTAGAIIKAATGT